MRFTSFFALASLSVSAFALTVDLSNVGARSGDAVATPAKAAPLKQCDPNYCGEDLPQKQYEALSGFAEVYAFQQNVKLAFDTWIPTTYIQHNPFSQQGRAFAIQYLTNAFASGDVTNSNMTLISGQGYGVMHYKMASPNITFAVVDYFRFNGTCIVEHWDVLQQITGLEVNPIAFF